MKTQNLKFILPLFVILLPLTLFSQKNNFKADQIKLNFDKQNSQSKMFSDTLKKKLVTKRSINAIFIGFGGGLSVPTGKFMETANPSFGIMGRLDFASTGIFPFVISGEVSYYAYNSPDEFRTINLLTGYRTKILSFGINIDYSLSGFIRSSFTMPYLSVDVKSNNIKREFDAGRKLEGLTPTETAVSVGAGVGFTMFILDFTIKYNYLKNNSYVSVTTKTKFPVIRF